MDKNTIKKELYKQKPIAELDYEEGDYFTFTTELFIEDGKHIIEFKVPTSEDFGAREVPAQLLIRWLV